jgi:hypothetical protein
LRPGSPGQAMLVEPAQRELLEPRQELRIELARREPRVVPARQELQAELVRLV